MRVLRRRGENGNYSSFLFHAELLFLFTRLLLIRCPGLDVERYLGHLLRHWKARCFHPEHTRRSVMSCRTSECGFVLTLIGIGVGVQGGGRRLT